MILGIGIVTLYLVIGAGLAKWDLPAAWERARQEWSINKYQVTFVKGAMALMFFFWPVKLTMLFVNNLLHTAAVESDPWEREKALMDRERQLKMAEHDAKVKKLEQQRYIERLEEELGIGGKS